MRKRFPNDHKCSLSSAGLTPTYFVAGGGSIIIIILLGFLISFAARNISASIYARNLARTPTVTYTPTVTLTPTVTPRQPKP